VTAPDPRPHLVESGGEWRLAGHRCTACGYRVAFARPWCPLCRAAVEPARFGPAGTVWASAVQRIPVPGLDPPVVFAYLDLDDGPRCLVQCAVDAEDPPAPGARLRLSGVSATGDPLAGPLEAP
jgi:hypothetical protein